VADVNGVAQVEMLDYGGDVRGVVVHVVAAAGLARPAMTTPVNGDDAVALLDEVEHLRIPVVTAQGPAVMKDDRLTGAPIFVKYLGAVFGRNYIHCFVSFFMAGRVDWTACLVSAYYQFFMLNDRLPIFTIVPGC
jgi:hypothetical protein